MAWVAAIVGLVGSAAASSAANSQADKAMNSEGALRNRELTLAEAQNARGEKLFDEYQQTYQPRERELVQDAFDDTNSPEAAAARATTDVRAASAANGQIAMRDARSLGIDPSSPAFQAQASGRQLRDTALEVSAKDTARRDARDTNFQRQYSVLSLGRNLPSTSAALTGNASASISRLSDAAARRTDQANSLAGQAGGSLGNSLGDLAAAGMKAYRSSQNPTGTTATTPMTSEQNLYDSGYYDKTGTGP